MLLMNFVRDFSFDDDAPCPPLKSPNNVQSIEKSFLLDAILGGANVGFAKVA